MSRTFFNFFRIVFFFFFCFSTIQAQEERPNIIIILADDLGWADVGYHGSEIKTPHIDKLAEEGVVLNRYYVTPICSPTRAGLLTGRYPDRMGIRNVVVRPWFDFGLDVNEKLLPEMLAEAGYKHRAIVGKWHLGHSRIEYHPLNRGFTHFYGHLNGAIDYFTHKREGELDWHNDYETSYDEGYATDLITNEAVDCIKSYSQEQAPFFLYVAYNAPHTPLQAQKEYLLQYGIEDNEFTQNQGQEEKARKIYSAMVTNMDAGIGKILQALKDLNIEDNTIVLFHSDNGGQTPLGNYNGGASNGKLRGEKLEEWEGGVRVPAIIKWPDGIKGGRKIEQVIGYIDVLPTIREILGLKNKTKNELDGLSMWPILNGEKDFVERNLYLGRGALVNQEWKIIRTAEQRPNTIERMKLNEDVLFNISKDPFEKDNVKNNYKKLFDELYNKVSEFDAIKPSRIPPPDEKPEGFKPPNNWKARN